MAEVNFRELWRKLSWEQRAKLEHTRGEIYITLSYIEHICAEYLKYKKQHKSTHDRKRALKFHLEQLRKLEFKMQRLWGLKEDEKYHTYWMMPKQCTCPKMDNRDRLGHGRVISGDCPLHGKGMLK